MVGGECLGLGAERGDLDDAAYARRFGRFEELAGSARVQRFERLCAAWPQDAHGIHHDVHVAKIVHEGVAGWGRGEIELQFPRVRDAAWMAAGAHHFVTRGRASPREV